MIVWLIDSISFWTVAGRISEDNSSAHARYGCQPDCLIHSSAYFEELTINGKAYIIVTQGNSEPLTGIVASWSNR